MTAGESTDIIRAMLKVYTETLDTARLQSRLDALLESDGARALPNRYPVPPSTTTSVRFFLQRSRWLRRFANAFSAWRFSGWSLRWLLPRIPLIGPFIWRAYGLLTQREFRSHVLAELAQLKSSQQTLQAAQKYQLQHAAMHAEINAEYQSVQRQIENMGARLCALENGIASSLSLEPGALAAESEFFSAWYLALENSLRGSKDAIEARLQTYLAHLSCAQVGQSDWPVLDLGCGRGEWLALLGKHGFTARGVDTNAAMLAEAEKQGLDVRQLDLLTALQQTAPSSIGAITAFQVIEHVNLATLLELFQQAWRVLHPGGVLLLETPNPENIQVGAYSFWLDPTHIRPLPPPLLAHSAAHFGFIDITIVRSNPWPASAQDASNSGCTAILNKLMFGYQDYALVARKPYE